VLKQTDIACHTMFGGLRIEVNRCRSMRAGTRTISQTAWARERFVGYAAAADASKDRTRFHARGLEPRGEGMGRGTGDRFVRIRVVRSAGLVGFGVGGPAPKLQQQMERIQRLPKAKQRFVMEMIDTVLAQQDR